VRAQYVLSTNRQAETLVYGLTTDSNSVIRDALLTATNSADLRAAVLSDQTVPDGNGQFSGFGNPTTNDATDVGLWGSILSSRPVTRDKPVVSLSACW